MPDAVVIIAQQMARFGAVPTFFRLHEELPAAGSPSFRRFS
jgi:hypothetical protein